MLQTMRSARSTKKKMESEISSEEPKGFLVSRKWRRKKDLSDEEILDYLVIYVDEAWQNIKISELYKTTKKVTRKAFPTYFLTQNEQDIYVKGHLKPPIFPGPHPPLYFYEQSGFASEGLNNKTLYEEANLMFGKLSEEDKNEWFRKLIKDSYEFLRLEEDFKAQLTNCFALYIYEQWFKKYFEERQIRVKKYKKRNYIEIEKSITAHYFKEQFIFPPVTIYQLYLELYSKEEKGNSLRISLNDLPDLVKNAYEAIIDYLKQQFIERTNQFVQKLGASDQKIFVGIKRKVFASNLAHQDIFENLYPIERFPAIKPTGFIKKDQIKKTECIKEENYDEDEEDMPEDFDAFQAIRSSINQLQLLVDYDLDTDSD